MIIFQNRIRINPSSLFMNIIKSACACFRTLSSTGSTVQYSPRNTYGTRRIKFRRFSGYAGNLHRRPFSAFYRNTYIISQIIEQVDAFYRSPLLLLLLFFYHFRIRRVRYFHHIIYAFRIKLVLFKNKVVYYVIIDSEWVAIDFFPKNHKA